MVLIGGNGADVVLKVLGWGGDVFMLLDDSCWYAAVGFYLVLIYSYMAAR